MTARERLFAALDGEPTDRTPMWLLFPYHPLGCYVDVRSNPRYRAIHEAALTYAITLNRRSLSVPLHTSEVTRREEETRAGGEAVVRRHTEYRGKSIYSEHRQPGSGQVGKKLLTTSAELEFFCSLPVEVDRVRLVRALESNLPQYLREKEEFPTDSGAMMLALGEPIGCLYGRSDTASYAMWSLTQGDRIRNFLGRLQEQYRIVYDWCLERGLADVYFLVGSELASPPLVSRATFRDWVVPYASELINMIRDGGARSIQHYHGQIHKIMPDFLTMRPDGLHTIEAPPIGDCTLAQAYEVTGDEIALIGNTQYDDFRALTPEEMTVHVRETLDQVGSHPFILSPTAGPFDPNISDHMVRNYLAFIQAGWRYGH